MNDLQQLVFTIECRNLSDNKKLVHTSHHFAKVTPEQFNGSKEKRMAPFPQYVAWKTKTMFRNILREHHTPCTCGCDPENNSATTETKVDAERVAGVM